MVQWTNSVALSGGATPQSFDGNQTFRFNDKASRLTGISLSQSESIYTTDEGLAIAIRLSENAGLSSKNPVFFMGWTSDAGPASNRSAMAMAPAYIPLDIGIAASSTMRIDLTTVAGAIQTGTIDTQVTAHYDAGDTPADVLAAAAGRTGHVPVKGGTYGYITAKTTTAEAALTGNGSTLNIPGAASQIVAVYALQVLDTTVTASLEFGGKVRFEFSEIQDQDVQEYPLNGGMPNLGTEVEGGTPSVIRPLPMYLTVPGKEINTSGTVSFLSAITGGADVAVNLLWR